MYYCKLCSAPLGLKASNYFLPFLSVRISAEHKKQWHLLTLKLARNSMKSMWNSCGISKSRLQVAVSALMLKGICSLLLGRMSCWIDCKQLDLGITVLQSVRSVSCIASVLLSWWLYRPCACLCSCEMVLLTFHLYFVGMKNTASYHGDPILCRDNAEARFKIWHA